MWANKKVNSVNILDSMDCIVASWECNEENLVNRKATLVSRTEKWVNI